MITNLREQVAQAGGLYNLVARLQKEKRQTYSVNNVRWLAPEPKFIHKGRGVVVSPSSAPVVEPKKKIKPLKNLATVDSVEDVVEPPTEDDTMVELNCDEKPVVAGEDIEEQERGDGQDDTAVVVDECE